MAEQLSYPKPGATGQAAETVDFTGARLIGSQTPDPDSLLAPVATRGELPERPPADEGDGHVLPVPHIYEAVATVRRRAHTLLTEWELSADCLDEALMVISELVTNAILHALPPAVLRLSWTECEGSAGLRIEVTDGGPVPAGQRADEDIEPDEHGRGLGIVTALSTRHGSHSCHEGITWWADLPVA
ncbi:ATP-binding protein [Streptomyces antimycoticus]|uniref:ATP-binding protein n=1 Tax=Streptomyces antimycoticus TaxID=68175 RepID=UPI00256FCE04|nr:ATP-binding protein [Streptomyces antimycoticus]WJE01571.1 ATP-binding protein [Streptomyces antimycoticus]